MSKLRTKLFSVIASNLLSALFIPITSAITPILQPESLWAEAEQAVKSGDMSIVPDIYLQVSSSLSTLTATYQNSQDPDITIQLAIANETMYNLCLLLNNLTVSSKYRADHLFYCLKTLYLQAQQPFSPASIATQLLSTCKNYTAEFKNFKHISTYRHQTFYQLVDDAKQYSYGILASLAEPQAPAVDTSPSASFLDSLPPIMQVNHHLDCGQPWPVPPPPTYDEALELLLDDDAETRLEALKR